MPLICALCQVPIKSGEHIVSDGDKAVAHDHCVRKEMEPSVEAAKAAAFKMAHNIQVSIAEARMAYAEPCLLPSAPKVCSECQKLAISMCPACSVYVHQNYGYDGGTACSILHEAKCEGARKSRSLEKKRVEEPYSLPSNYTIEVPGRNGKHKASNQKRKKR